MNKKSIDLEARKAIIEKITDCYNHNNLVEICNTGVLYMSKIHGVVWVYDYTNFLAFLNDDTIDLNYKVYRFSLINNTLVTLEA